MTQEATDIEVNPSEALAEARGEVDQAPEEVTTPQPEEKSDDRPDDVLDTIKPKSQPKKWTLGPVGDPEKQKEYVQRPLGYFAKMEWFGLLGEVIDKSVSGEQGVRISQVFGGAPVFNEEMLSNLSDADTFIQAIGKVLTFAPDFLEKSYCVWLDIPDFERPWAIASMRLSPEKGGLSDDDGVEIIEIFIDQNWEAVESFFRDKISSLRARVRQHQEESQSRRSKPSNTTQDGTPNQ